MKGKIKLADVKIVEILDYSLDENGKYKKEYWGKCVYEETSDMLHFFTKDGNYLQAISHFYDSDGSLLFSPKDWIEENKNNSDKIKEQSDEILKLKEELQEKEDKTEKLLKLKEKFTIDEIIRLNDEVMI